MRFDIISAVPDLLESPLNHSIVKRAKDLDIVEIHTHNLRDYSEDKHRKVDDYMYGPGAGMVLSPQPIFSCIDKLKSERIYDEIIFMTPAGTQYSQKVANELSLKKNIIILCGHYKGVDQRVREALVTLELSVGDFVLSGGELPAMMLTDSIVRLLPGVLGDSESALTDSFQDGLLEGPVYTRPEVFKNMNVPEILLSGDHNRVKKWKQQKALEWTRKKRPDLYKKFKKDT